MATLAFAIAGLVAWRLAYEGLPLPAWTLAPNRYLSTPSSLDVDPADPVPSAAAVPEELAKRGVLAWRDTSVSV